MTNLLEGSKTLKPKTPIIDSVAEFTPEALNQDGIWAHAFDESNAIEIPEYLDNPIKTGLSYMDYILGDAGFYPTQCTILTGDPGCGICYAWTWC